MQYGMLIDEASSESLIKELDKRLAKQGVDLGKGSVEIIVDYLEDGWTLLAFPSDIVEQYDLTVADGQKVHMLVADLRKRLMELEDSG